MRLGIQSVILQNSMNLTINTLIAALFIVNSYMYNVHGSTMIENLYANTFSCR